MSCLVPGINLMFFFSCNFCLHYKVLVAPVEEENTNVEHELVSKNCTIGAAKLEL